MDDRQKEPKIKKMTHDKRVSPAKDELKMFSKLATLVNLYFIRKLMASMRKKVRSSYRNRLFITCEDERGYF